MTLKSILLAVYAIGVFTMQGTASDMQYRLVENIPYYSAERTESDAYLKERCKLDLYYPINETGYATAVWFHGGGLKSGNKAISDRLKEQGIAVAAVNYRLFPKAKAPAYLEDAAAATAWIFRHIERLGGDPEKVFVSGSSAGGYLTAMIGLDKRWLAAHNVDADRIAGLIPLAGQMFTHFTVREERGIGRTDVVVDDLAPVSHIRKDAPPLLIVTGDRELEMIARWEENAYMHRMLLEVGHPDVRILELQGYGHAPREPFYPLLLKEVERVIELKDKKLTTNGHE